MALRALVPWRRGVARPSEMDPFTALQNEVNRTFESFFADDFFPAAATALNPKLDLSETDKEFHLSMELPGLTEKDVDVELTEHGLKIHGEKKDERETKDHNFHRTERVFGAFDRMVPLNTKIDRDKVVATFKNGILSVVLPKAEPVVTQTKINVVAGN